MINLSTPMFDVIEKDLERLEEGLYKAIEAPEELVTKVGEHLVAAGGKRIRPALAILSAHGSKGFSLERILPLAIGLELIHMASLVHDDVIDAADTRRGAATANAKWGNQVAILAGDYVFARAFSLIAGASYGEYVSKRLATLVCNLSVGEIIQDQAAFQASRGMADYYDRIQKKTADFLEISCELGAFVCGASKDDADKLADYGHSIGMAFQITDDLLDIEQTAEKIGKPAGNDIRQGIVTLPVIRAIEISPDSSELEDIIKNPEMDAADVKRALAIVKASDGVAFAKAKADEYLAHAKSVIPKSFPKDVREAFEMVSDFIGDRDF